MKYSHIIQAVRQTPWALMPSKMAEIQGFLIERAFQMDISADEVRERIGAKAKPRAGQKGSIVIMDVFGVMSQRIDNMDVSSGGGFSTEKFAQAFSRFANDPSVKAIVLNIDSPGGSVFGVQELADQIYQARETKHIVAVANSLAASAAYWIGSQADEFVVTPSGQVGSIGVYSVHEDWSKAFEMKGVKPTVISAGKYKVETSGFGPLTDEAIEALQEDVDAYYNSFTKSVARGRGVAVSEVKSGYGEGRVLTSAAAKKAGLVDRVASFDEVLSGLGISPETPKQNLSARGNLNVAKRRLDLLQ